MVMLMDRGPFTFCFRLLLFVYYLHFDWCMHAHTVWIFLKDYVVVCYKFSNKEPLFHVGVGLPYYICIIYICSAFTHVMFVYPR